MEGERNYDEGVEDDFNKEAVAAGAYFVVLIGKKDSKLTNETVDLMSGLINDKIEGHNPENEPNSSKEEMSEELAALIIAKEAFEKETQSQSITAGNQVSYIEGLIDDKIELLQNKIANFK